MKIIKTETGSSYHIDGSWCTKYNSEGTRVELFKVFHVSSFPPEINSLEEFYKTEPEEVKIGNRLYLSNLDSWWVSTCIVSIEEV